MEEKVSNYKKHISGATTEIVSNPVNCENADISSSHSATLEFKELTCKEDVKINVDHSATLIIGTLVCKGGKINVSYASTLHIKNIKCSGKLQIEVSYSSTFLADAGQIDITSGTIKYSSLGVCYAKIGTDDVVAETSSTWKT